MINLTNNEKLKLLKIANNFSIGDIHILHRTYIDKHIPMEKLRAVQVYHKELEHIIEIAKILNADFILSHEEEEKINQQLTKPIDIIWEGTYQRTKPNEKCLLNKTVPDIHRHINKLLSSYNGRNKYINQIAFIYNYLVQNGLENKAININDIKNKILKNKRHIVSSDNHNQPEGTKKYFEQSIPF